MNHMGVSKNRGTPKSSTVLLKRFSIINHDFFLGNPIFGNIHTFCLYSRQVSSPQTDPNRGFRIHARRKVSTSYDTLGRKKTRPGTEDSWEFKNSSSA